MKKLSQTHSALSTQFSNCAEKSEPERWRIYEHYKRHISSLGLTEKQYQQRIRYAVEALQL